MIVQEFLKKVDIDKQVELICSNQPDYEKPYNPNNVKIIQTKFINTLLSLTPKCENNIIIFEKHLDDLEDIPKEYVAAELYYKDELSKYLETIKSLDCPIIDFNEYETNDKLKELFYSFPTFPQAYAYEFTKWEEILGWEVYDGNLNEFDIQECIHTILYEMSFNGITRESQEERLNDLLESIEENEKIMKLPQEERDKHYISLEEIEQSWKEEFGWEPPTEEEKYENIRVMWVCAIKTAIWKFYNFKKMI